MKKNQIIEPGGVDSPLGEASPLGRSSIIKQKNMNWQLIGQIWGYFGIGFLEMFLATQRTYWISNGK